MAKIRKTIDAASHKIKAKAIHVLAYKKLAEIAERTSVDVSAELCNAA
jgi:hypothetical protein